MSTVLTYRVVKTLMSLFLEEEKGNVANKKRFLDEYGGETLFLPKTNPKPDDYNAIFSGNTDDNFKIGISLTKKTVKVITLES
jgi:U3 small nucleolar RNA-associated protein 25